MIDIGSKFIHALEVPSRNTQPAYAIIDKRNSTLAYIEFYPSWKKYVFTQADVGIIFDVSCLECIIKFMRGLK